MDHAGATESEGHVRTNAVGDNPRLRGNDTEPTSELMFDGEDEALDVDDLAFGQDEGHGSMEVDAASIEEGSIAAIYDAWPSSDVVLDDDELDFGQDEMEVEPASIKETCMAALSDGEPFSVVVVESMAPAAAAPTSAGSRVNGAEERRTEEHPPSCVADAVTSERNPDKTSIGVPPAKGKPAARSEAIRATEAFGVNEPPPELSSNTLGAVSADQSSFELGHDMSVDDEDDDDILSDKASSTDFQSDSDAFLIGQRNADRAPLENAYGSFIHPTDTCLADARERLHVALEQTRLLGASFTEQAYERYRCLMKPVHESLEEIIEPILIDPGQALETLREETDAIKVEKDMEKNQALQAGVGLEELAYFGEGLHLVVLPEDEVDETEIDITQFPDRGPTNPETGEHVEEISAAAASATEQVFDRIRRIRAIRMGGDIGEVGIPQRAKHLTRNLAQDHQTWDESFSPGFSSAAFASNSPALSIDSYAFDTHHHSSKGSLQHLLTLAPDAEGARPDGNFTAVQSALIARGVGMHEMKRDSRINPLRQRMVQPNYFFPTPSNKFLPPLLGPHQIYRLQAAEVRREKLGVRSGARQSIKSVLEDICSSLGGSGVETAGKNVKGYGRRIDDSSVGGLCVSSGGTKKAPYDERSALEFGLLRRMHSAMLKSQRIEGTLSTSNGASHAVTESTDLGSESLHSISDSGDFDPLLAFSVMNAVGLVRRKDGNIKHQLRVSSRNTENAYAQTLGLDNLASLASVKAFFRTISTIRNGKKRHLSGEDNEMNDAKRMKSDIRDTSNGDNIEGIHEIRGGGGQDDVSSIESKIMSKESGEIKKNGVSKSSTSKADAPISNPPLAGYAGFGPMYNAMSQVPEQSQDVMSSHQLWQRQLGIPSDLYHTAPLSHQLTGSHLNSLQSDLSDFHLRNGMVGTPDWAALRTANSAARAEFLAQHPQLLTTSLGIFPGQMNLNFLEQELARTMLLRDHQNAAAARAHGAATAAASARYQATMSSINHQNPFGFQDRSNEMHFIPSLSASHSTKEEKGTDSKKLQRKRSWSLTEKMLDSCKEMKRTTTEMVADTKRPASAPPSPLIFEDAKRPALAPPSPRNFELNKPIPNGSSKALVSCDVASIPELNFALPTPPMGLDKEIADLIAHAKFHEAHSLSQSKADKSELLLVEFLLSLGAAIPIPKDLIAVPLVKKLGSSNFQLRLHEFAGSSSSATASRETLVAIISIWLWTEHKHFFKQTIVTTGIDEADSSYKWLINLAIDMSLSALANFFDSYPSGKNYGQTKDIPNEQVAAIVSKSLANQVFVDYRADASFPILEDLVKLLDSLRTDALRAKTQERVLLAALASRCGNMTEAFSNAYVSSIVRAGVALGHENVCEMGQDEACRASTLLPYDYFHDNFGVWEEPCRPITGYHAAVGGEELKRQAHARSLIQKSMMRLQNRLGVKGGITDGGPYFPVMSPVKTSTPLTPATVPPLVKTPSGSLKRRGSHDNLGMPGPGEQDLIFNPDHSVEPMLWDPNDVANLPYGDHEFGGKPIGVFAMEKKKNLHGDVSPGYRTASLAAQYPSTQELEWEDVANMFFHGGSTRSIDINYDFDSHDQLGKKKIFAPFVRAFDISSINQESAEQEPYSDEDMSDEAIFQRHQNGLDEMKLTLDAALESRKQLSQQRGRKR